MGPNGDDAFDTIAKMCSHDTPQPTKLEGYRSLTAVLNGTPRLCLDD